MKFLYFLKQFKFQSPEKRFSGKKIPGKTISGKGSTGKKIPWKKVLRDKVSKKRPLLKEWPGNLRREVEQFFYFYRLIPPDDSTHIKRCSALNPQSHIHQTMGSGLAGFVLPGTIFHGNFFSRDHLSGDFLSRGTFSKTFFQDFCYTLSSISKRQFNDLPHHYSSVKNKKIKFPSSKNTERICILAKNWLSHLRILY